MSPEFKPLATLLLQARVDGKLTGSADFFLLLEQESVIKDASFAELEAFIQELTPADTIPEARKVAEKYGLEITL